jgi:hypothetical protein
MSEKLGTVAEKLIDMIAEYTKEVKGTQTLSPQERIRCELLAKDALVVVRVNKIHADLEPYLGKYIGED